jgi:hypothetical protein
MKVALFSLVLIGSLSVHSRLGAAENGGDAGRARASLPLPNIWGSGQVLRYSGLDGPTHWDTRFWGVTGSDRYEIYLKTDPEIRIRLTFKKGEGELRYFTGDALYAESAESWIALTFWQQSCLIGRCHGKATPQISFASEGGWKDFAVGRPLQLKSGTGARGGESHAEYVVFNHLQTLSNIRWALAYDREDPVRAQHRAEMGLIQNVLSLCRDKAQKAQSIDFDLASCSEDEVRTALKACCILRGAYKAPEGQFVAPWSAPSPYHVHLNVWDTLFHCYGTRFLDPVLPEQDALMLLQAQREDGFIGNPQRPPAPSHDARGIHPPLIGWALWNSYQQRKDVHTLVEAYPRLVKFIEWIRNNKDSNNNLLLEWRHTDGCESGRDNDPRFDRRLLFDSVDFTGFIGSELLYLGLMADELGFKGGGQKWREEHARIQAAFNEHLWDEEDGFYYDRTADGKLIRVKTNATFVGLFGGLATPERAERLVREHLLNPEEFWTAMPVPTVSLDDPLFELDMWRGPVWHCYNHLVLDGLLRYGFDREAEELIRRTVDASVHWYTRTGSLWEFYDPENKLEPRKIDRKGVLKGRTGFEGRGNIPEYSWSAAEFLHFLDLAHRGGENSSE